MKKNFAMTLNAQRFTGAIQALEERGAEEACLIVLHGPPGLGKTRTVDWWVVQNGGIRVDAQPKWTVAWMLRDILKKLDPNIKGARSADRLTTQIKPILAGRNRESAAYGKVFGVVIDEAEPVVKDIDLLETLRKGFINPLEIPFILVGMKTIKGDLTKAAEQASSRVCRYVEFKPSNVDDVALLVKELSEAPITDDLIAFLAKESKGFIREIKEGIKSIERFSKTNPGVIIGRKEMRGQALMYDRTTGQEIKVRA